MHAMSKLSRTERRSLQDAQRSQKALQKMDNRATEIWLVRHGQTDWNLQQRFQGQGTQDPPLNDVGVLQAHALAEALKSTHFDCLWVSDLRRACMTADILAKDTGWQVFASSALRERDVGVLTGLTHREALLQQPQALHALTHADEHAPLPGGGESLSVMRRRCVTALSDIAAAHPGQRVLVVTHGGVLHALHRHIRGGPARGSVANGAVAVVKLQGDDWVLLSWNDTAHLEKCGALECTFGGGGNGG